jgi:hypothetical protein
VTVLRLSFEPNVVVVLDRKPDVLRLFGSKDAHLWDKELAKEMLPKRSDLSQNGYTLKPLGNGDFLVAVRHDAARGIFVGTTAIAVRHDEARDTITFGTDPQVVALATPYVFFPGLWDSGPRKPKCPPFDGDWSFGPQPNVISHQPGATATWTFTGNQVRVIGDVGAEAGLADVYLDGVKQLVPIDCWNPTQRWLQTLFYRNGLSNGKHELKIVVLGKSNPRSKWANVNISIGGACWSAATSTSGFGEGGGPTDVQRWVFGYPGREDLKDSAGNLWRPATEWIVRTGTMTDSVAAAWWTTPCPEPIAGTKDPQLYRYGTHANEFISNVTVGPGTYYVRLKFAATRGIDTKKNCVTVEICGKRVLTKLDVAAKAGGPNKAFDLTYNNIAPRNGVIDIRFLGGDPDQPGSGEAFVQALEVGPSRGGTGATQSPAAQ